jgi:hypothetical protein
LEVWLSKTLAEVEMLEIQDIPIESNPRRTSNATRRLIGFQAFTSRLGAARKERWRVSFLEMPVLIKSRLNNYRDKYCTLPYLEADLRREFGK